MGDLLIETILAYIFLRRLWRKKVSAEPLSNRYVLQTMAKAILFNLCRIFGRQKNDADHEGPLIFS
jgi:hypothetical protein